MPATTSQRFASPLTRRLALASVALSALVPAVLLPAPAHAQALQPVVDVCTGISLPRSAVTGVIGAVNGPIVSQIEASVDALKTVSLVVAPLLNVPDLNIDLSGILTAAAQGQPLSVQVLDTQGNIVAPGDCNIGADGFTLNTPAGIAIGGNAITGLGANGQAATAVPLDAIAFGNNASATAAATGGVAIGTGASVTAANGVAIGAGALADRTAQTNYAAPGLTGTFNSIGSVSVGTAGGLRQITNVAPGTAASDAATVGQVQGAVAAVNAASALAVQYNDVTRAAVTLAGAGGTTIDNLAPGTLGAASTQAVNGSQLFATNQTVAGNTAAIGANTTAIAGNTTAITAIDARVTTNTNAIGTLDAAAVKYDDPSDTLVTFQGAGGTRLTNVAPGTLGAASTDAVNGSQLFATNQAVAGNTAAIATNTGAIAGNTTAITTINTQVAANTGAIGALDASAVKYDDPSHAVVTFTGPAGTRLTNVTAGTLSAASTDAVNGSQLFATNQAVAGLDTRVTANTTAITNIDARLTTTQAAVANAVQYDDATKGTITLGGAGGTTISNVAPGTLGAGSTQAVNGSQLFATNTQVAGNTTAITNLDGRVTTNTTNIANNTSAITNLDGRVTTNTTNIANLDGRVTSNTTNIANNTSAITNLDGRVTTNTTNIASLDGRVTTNTTAITNLDGRVTTIDGRVTTNTTNIANLDGRVTNNTSSITNLDGRVTGNTTNITTLQTQVANVPVRYVADADKTTPSATPTNTVALAPANGTAATLTKVGAGTLSASSTDAVNGSQLFATNTQVASNTTAITQLSTTLAGAPRTPVQYSNAATPTTANGGTPTNDVTLVGANPAAPVALHNVANGMLSNDAANLGQLQNGLASTLATSRAYTDQQIAAIGFDLSDLGDDVRQLRKGAFAGTAAAMAVAGIPQTMEAGQSMFGGAVGHYRGRTAFALGASTTLNDGQAVVKAGATMDTNGKGGFSAGAGFAF